MEGDARDGALVGRDAHEGREDENQVGRIGDVAFLVALDAGEGERGKGRANEGKTIRVRGRLDADVFPRCVVEVVEGAPGDDVPGSVEGILVIKGFGRIRVMGKGEVAGVGQVAVGIFRGVDFLVGVPVDFELKGIAKVRGDVGNRVIDVAGGIAKAPGVRVRVNRLDARLGGRSVRSRRIRGSARGGGIFRASASG